MTYILQYQDIAQRVHDFKAFTNKKKAQHVLDLFKRHGKIAWLLILGKTK